MWQRKVLVGLVGLLALGCGGGGSNDNTKNNNNNNNNLGGFTLSGKLASLKRMKDDVREVKAGFECGLKIEGYEDIKEGDIVESYEIKEEKRTLI